MPMRVDYPRYPRDVRQKQIVSRSAQERRLAELHLTAYPSVVNAEAMPHSPRDEEEENNNNNKKKNNINNKQQLLLSTPMEERAIPPMTTNQLVARMAAMAREEEERKKKEINNNEKKNLSAPDSRVMAHAASFDRSSTYRLDYCNKDVPGFHERVRVIPDYTQKWTEIDKSNIEEAKKFPFLTIPESLLKKKPTVYRHDYIPAADREDYRTLSHKTNLQELKTTFAYSAYTLDDPVREVKYDKVVASCRNPRCLLWKTHSPRDSFVDKSKALESTADELRRLRELRQYQLSRSTESRSPSTKSGSETEEKTNRKIIMPGMRGMGSRQAPKEGEDYIYLPRDHFCHQTVYDY